MLTMPYEGAERIAAVHRAKFAYVYVRQSTAGQVSAPGKHGAAVSPG